ncbi:MAG: hypothetical protein IKX40_07600 [Thermoguttaceae bacterium]|nr:hypothetical protein [Thermoguttaceae bacterium]
MKPNQNRIIAVMLMAVLGAAPCSLPAQAQMQYRQSVRRAESQSSTQSNSFKAPQALTDAASDRGTRQYVSSELQALQGLSQDDALRLQSVLMNVTVFRRLPVYQVESDKSMVMFMVNHPDAVVNIWEKMGISQITVRERGDGLYEVSDIAGTSGWMKRLWVGENAILYYLEGSYTGSLLKNDIRGKALVLARFSASKNSEGAEILTCYVDTFLSLEQKSVDLGVRLLFPMLGKVADNNLEQTLAFVRWYSDGCKSSPALLSSYAMELKNIRLETRQELARQTQLMAARYGGASPEFVAQNSEPKPVDYSPFQQEKPTESYYVPEKVPENSVSQPTPVRVGYPPVGNDTYKSLEIFDDEEY